VNPNVGGIALGHPLGALTTMRIGVGQGPARGRLTREKAP
jgi:hypothetical protein